MKDVVSSANTIMRKENPQKKDGLYIVNIQKLFYNHENSIAHDI